MNPRKGETVTSIHRNYQRKTRNPLPLIDIAIKIIARAIRLKINIRLCFDWLSVIFFDVLRPNVIITISMIIAVLCSTIQ